MGPKSYAAFEGQVLGDAIGGHFDLKENRLVMFDFRGPGANPKAPVPELDNTLALVHETIHQLTYNTGVLDLKADVPLCVSEGLATYGETWRPRHKGEIGVDQRPAAAGARARPPSRGSSGFPWRRSSPTTSSLDDAKTAAGRLRRELDVRLQDDEGPGLAAEVPGLPPALREKPDPARRIELATAHLGDLARLDREIRTGR